jgi:hypothetical protein
MGCCTCSSLFPGIHFLGSVLVCSISTVAISVLYVFRIFFGYAQSLQYPSDIRYNRRAFPCACVITPFLRTRRKAGTGKRLLNWNWRCAYANGMLSCLKAERLEEGYLILMEAICPLQKTTSVARMTSSWTQKFWDRFGWRPLQLGMEWFWLKASKTWDGMILA